MLEYLPILIFLGIAAVIGVGAVAASYIAAPQNPDADKVSAYECGFDAFDDARGEFILTAAEEKGGVHPSDPPYVALVRIPVAAPSTARTTAHFCSLDGDAYTCPKVLAHRFSNSA